MAVITASIDHYYVRLSRGSRLQLNERDSIEWQALIVMQGKPWQIFAFFVKDVAAAPPNFRSPVVNRLFVFLPLEHYPHWLDILRNEAPLAFVFDECHPAGAALVTAAEPVGEGEAVCCPPQDSRPPAGGDAPQSAPFDAFEPNARDHSWANSYLLAVASYYIYGEGGQLNAGGAFYEQFVATLRPWLAPPEDSSVRFDFVSDENLLGGAGTQAMVMSTSRFVLVIFRGTQTVLSNVPSDWLTNAAFAGAPAPVLWAEPGVVAHNGWLHAANATYDDIIDLIHAHRDGQNKPLWVAGHSLGGALTLLLALRIQTSGDYQLSGACTYGCPPTGGGSFYQAFNNQDLQQRIYRWVNNDDIVPQLPLLGYSAVGRKFFINESGTVIPDAPPAAPTFPSIADHNMLSYARLIHANLPAQLQSRLPSI
ncbi:MAG TPA: lipase family protein [Gammaproteobacteria bacterium]|nr:lipase family protein [Gammaproteobacteria bacterium]